MTSKHFKPVDGEPDKVLAGLPKLRRSGELDAGEPMTVVGRMTMQPAMGIAAENERLKAERATGGVVVKLDPKQVGISKFANRHLLGLDLQDERFASLVQSFRLHGQDQSILVRPAPADTSHGLPYEVAFGHRRHAAAFVLDRESPSGWHLEARVKDLSDLELVMQMNRENEERENLSAFEKGCQYKLWIKEGLFARQADIAEAIGVHENTILKNVQVADLPSVILEAFGDPRSIPVKWIQDLMRVLKSHRSAMLKAAEAIKARATPPSSAKTVLEELLQAGHTAAPDTPRARQETVKDPKGRVLFRVSRRKGTFRINWISVDPTLQKDLAEEIQELAYQRLMKRPIDEVAPPSASKRRSKS